PPRPPSAPHPAPTPHAPPPPARHSHPPPLVVPGRRVLLRLAVGRSFPSRPAVPRWRFVLRRVPERCSVLRLADPGVSRLALSGRCSALRWRFVLRLAIPGRPRVPRRAGFRVPGLGGAGGRVSFVR